MRLVRSLAWLLVAAPVALAGSEPLDRHPIPLRHPAPETPLETAGTGLAPEVSVRVTIDTTGKVTDVEVLGITPSSEYDGLFRETTEGTLRRWRYAPRLSDGKAVEAKLAWTIAYPSREEGTDPRAPAPSVLPRRTPAALESNSFERRQRTLLTMDAERRAKNLQQCAERAARSLDESRMRKATTPRFIVYSDAPDERVAEIAAGNLEATFNILDTLLGQRLAPQAEPFRIVCFVYASESGFDRLRQSLIGREWAVGFYYPVGLLAFHMELPSNEALVSTLLHEATHAYLDRYVARPGVVLPVWFHEGLAEYVGNSEVKKGELIPGKVRRFDIYRGPWGSRQWFSGPRVELDEIKSAVKRGERPGLADVIGASGETFYGENPRSFYMMAWLIVHFLRHGEESWASERFPALALYLAEGFDAEAALREVYGDPSELARRFQDYVRRF